MLQPESGAPARPQDAVQLAPELRRAAGLLLHERVEIYNLNNGQRFATYVIGGRKRGEVMINGAAARLVQPGDETLLDAFVEKGQIVGGAHAPGYRLSQCPAPRP